MGASMHDLILSRDHASRGRESIVAIDSLVAEARRGWIGRSSVAESAEVKLATTSIPSRGHQRESDRAIVMYPGDPRPSPNSLVIANPSRFARGP